MWYVEDSSYPTPDVRVPFWSSFIDTIHKVCGYRITPSAIIAIFGIPPDDLNLPTRIQTVIAFASPLARRTILLKWKAVPPPSQAHWIKDMMQNIKLVKMRCTLNGSIGIRTQPGIHQSIMWRDQQAWSWNLSNLLFSRKVLLVTITWKHTVVLYVVILYLLHVCHLSVTFFLLLVYFRICTIYILHNLQHEKDFQHTLAPSSRNKKDLIASRLKEGRRK